MIINSRIKRLKKVVGEYLHYTKWKAVNIFLIDDRVFVVWLRPQAPKSGDDGIYLDYTSRTFPGADLTKQIRSYRDKIIVEQAKAKEAKE